MQRLAVVTDSTSDLLPDLAASRGVTIVPLTLTLRNRDYLDGVDITPETFYRLIEETPAHATTSQPAPQRFVDVYRSLLETHESVVSIHISSKLSGTCASAQQAAAEVDPSRIKVVDSGLASLALGLEVLGAAALAREGAGVDDVITRSGEVARAMRTYFTVATLEYLKRGGRIGRASALVGSVLHVKPVLTLREGEVVPLERVRTLDRALARLVELVEEVDPGSGLCALVAHAADPETAARVADAVSDRCETLLVLPLGPVVGAHAGPGTIGVACYPQHLLPLGLKRPEATAAPL